MSVNLPNSRGAPLDNYIWSTN